MMLSVPIIIREIKRLASVARGVAGAGAVS